MASFSFSNAPRLDLAHPFARNPVFLAELFEGQRPFPEPARDQDLALALAEFGHRLHEQLVALDHLVARDQGLFLIRGLVDQPVLPFALGIGPERRVER